MILGHGILGEEFSRKTTDLGLATTECAVITMDLFKEKDFKKVRIPRIGYGRNAKPILKNGLQVTGIEISRTAHELAQNYFGSDLKLIQGRVTDITFKLIVL